jgi:hypothetical protein
MEHTEPLTPEHLGWEATDADVLAFQHLVAILGDEEAAWNEGDWTAGLLARGYRADGRRSVVRPSGRAAGVTSRAQHRAMRERDLQGVVVTLARRCGWIVAPTALAEVKRRALRHQTAMTSAGAHARADRRCSDVEEPADERGEAA